MPKHYSNLTEYRTNVRLLLFKHRAVSLLFNVLWFFSPTAAKALLAKLFFAPSPYPLSPRQLKTLEAGETFHLTVHGNTIQCWRWGDGPAILFVHGWNGRAGHFDRFVAPFVAAGYSVIALDAPAHGNSEGNTTNYFQYTDTLRALTDPKRGLNIIGMVGHSIGASATINCITKENPDLDAVLIAPALRLREILFNIFALHGIPSKVYRSAVSDLEHHFGYDLDRDNPDVLIDQIRSPVFIIHDREDKTIPFRDSQAVSTTSAHVLLQATEGLGHKRILADTGVIQATLDYFLEARHEQNRLVTGTG